MGETLPAEWVGCFGGVLGTYMSGGPKTPPNRRAPSKAGALALAIEAGDALGALELLASGAALHEGSGKGSSPLNMSIAAGMFEVAQAIIEKSAGVRAGPEKEAIYKGARDDRSAVVLALMREEEELAIAMAEAGATINGAPNEHGVDPLMIAIESIQAGAALALLRAGADPAAKNKHGEACLARALSLPLEEVSLAIIESISRGKTPASHLLSQPNRNGDSPLCLAINARRDRDAGALIRAGASLMDRAGGGGELLPWAIAEGRREVALAMVARSARMLPGERSCLNSVSEKGCAALPLALGMGQEDVALALIEAGADLSCSDPNGASSLCVAIKSSMPKAARAIVAAAKGRSQQPKKILDGVDGDGVPAIAWAARRGWEGLARRMIDAGADPNPLGEAKGSTFWRANQSFSEELLAELVKRASGEAVPAIDPEWSARLDAGEEAKAKEVWCLLALRTAGGFQESAGSGAKRSELALDMAAAAKAAAREMVRPEDLLAIEKRDAARLRAKLAGVAAKAAAARERLATAPAESSPSRGLARKPRKP